MNNDLAKKIGRKGINAGISMVPLFICLILSLAAGVIFTWPLVPNFFSSIPYTLKPIPGFERVPLMPGDHLQTYYWFWLLPDNFWGGSSLFTNPYEFNGPTGPMSTVYANFPFSLLYILFLPLGAIGAYNSLILLSFLFSGLAMFLLARAWTNDSWASLFSGLIFAVVPYRISHIAGGQFFGHIIFLLPLCLYFVELALEKKRIIYGGAAGLCIILTSFTEHHTTFLTALTLGLYIPSRILLIRPFLFVQGEKTKPLWPGFLGALIGGLAFSCFLWMWLGKKSGLPFWHIDMVQPLILGTLATLLAWFYLSALLARITVLSFIEARHLIGKGFFLFTPLLLYLLKYRLEIPRLGLILPLFCFISFLTYLINLFLKQRDRFLMFNRPQIVAVFLGVGMGLAIASAYLMHIRTTVLLPSVAGKGRTITEVLLFSPKIGNLFFWQDINKERYVILGWGLIILAVLGLVPLFKNKAKNPGHLALAGVLAFGAILLTLGPTLNYFPIYQILYNYFPFFNYPRVPGRFVMVGFIFLGLLSAMALAGFREWLASRGWIRLRKWFPLLIIPLILAEYHTYQPLGIYMMTGYNRIYTQIKKGLPKGGMVLELPIWPGDSHQSSAYEYTVTRTRKPMINGYAPVVFRDYIQQVFWPLYPMDFGELNQTQVEKLKTLNVDLITFHDNAQIFTEKVSPFTPRMALKRLMVTPFLKLVGHDQDIYLFKFNSQFQGTPSKHGNPSQPSFLEVGVESPPLTKGDGEGFKIGSTITSPVSAVFYAHNLPQETGKFYLDPSASGYYLLMDERQLTQGRLIPRPGVGGNVAVSIPGQDPPGYLINGPHRYFPAGKYRARFRIKTGQTASKEEIGRLEIIGNPPNIINQKILLGKDIISTETWQDIPLEFEITQAKDIGFRIFFSGKATLYFNLAIIGFSDQFNGSGSVEAEDLLRQTGTVVSDPLASGKEAVFGKAGFHPPIYLCYGPYQTFESGRYRAKFFIRLKDPDRISEKTEVALLEVATDMGKRVLASRKLKVQDLRADAYRPIEVDFDVPFRCELGYRVKFSGMADLLVDRISIE